MASDIVSRNDRNVVSLDTFADDLPVSFDAAMAAFEARGMDVAEATAEEISDGFAIVEDKDDLVNVPFLILAVKFQSGDNGDYVTCNVITKDGERLRFSDGSSGLAEELRRMVDKRAAAGNPTPNAGILCKRGLSRSDYNVMLEDTNPKSDTYGEMVRTPATTFHIKPS